MDRCKLKYIFYLHMQSQIMLVRKNKSKENNKWVKKNQNLTNPDK